MKFERFDFSGDGRVTLSAYLHGPNPDLPNWDKRPAVLVCPGGGYNFCAAREAEPIALCYFAAGFHAFVLNYTVGAAAAFPQPLLELSQAMAFVRRHSGEWGILSEKIAVCGFSAGGHLCASLGVHWNKPELQSAAGVSAEENRPNAMILCYPVITTAWMDRSHSTARLIGDRNEEETRRLLNCHLNVGPQTPQTFLFHSFMDNEVPAEDSLAFAAALAKADVPFELHILPNGGHGLSLATMLTSAGRADLLDEDYAQWMSLSIRWLRRLFGQPEVTSEGERRPRFRPDSLNFSL